MLESSTFIRPVLHQITNRRGAILHLTAEYRGVNECGHVGSIVQNLVEFQRSNGFDAQVVIPGRPGLVNPRLDYVHIVGNSLQETYPLGEGAYQQLRSYAKEFWKFVESSNTPITLIHAHDAMGLVLALRPERLMGIRSIYSIYGPQDPNPLDYAFPALNSDPEISMGLTHRGMVSALRAGVLSSFRSIFWSTAHRTTLMNGAYQHFLKAEKDRGVIFIELPGNWRPVDSPTPPDSAKHRLDILYHEIIYGETGIEFANRALAEKSQSVKSLIYICNETVSDIQGRTKRALDALRGDHVLQDSINEIIGYGRGLHQEFDPLYRGALGTFVYLIGEGAKRLSAEAPIFIGINASGLAQRETPITQQEKGDKGAAVVGNRTLNQIVTVASQMVAKQLPLGEWLILAASDNAFAGRITVGDHLLSEDEHGIINLTVPETVLGKGITVGDEKLKPLEQLGIVLVNPNTGAVLGFEEKIPVIKIQDLARRTGGVIDTNSMVKLMRKDIAELYNEEEHYMRPSHRDGKPFLFAYAAQTPDWSKLHDEPAVSSCTLEKWMLRFKEKSGYDRRDWRMFWIIANDIVLSSLEKIALKQEYFGGIAKMTDESDPTKSTAVLKEIRDKAISILAEFGGFNAENDPPQKDWYFKRNRELSLKANWKELFLACRTIKHKFGVNAKDEWMKRKPAAIEYDSWKMIWDTSLKLDEEENGLAAGRIDGFWLDTGTKREFFNAWLMLVHEDPTIRETVRKLSDVSLRGVEPSITGQENLLYQNPATVHIGGKTSFISAKGGKIHIGNNVIIRDSVIIWNGEGDLTIPSNTVIYDSRIEDIDPTVRDDGATLIYRFKGTTGQTFEIDTPQGKKQIKFGFYDGVMFGSMSLKDGSEVSTVFPLDLNLKEKPDLSLIEKYITNPDLRYHFRQYYGDGVDVIKKPMPFAGMIAADILKQIGF